MIRRGSRGYCSKNSCRRKPISLNLLVIFPRPLNLIRLPILSME
jgi:hypothetical protein